MKGEIHAVGELCHAELWRISMNGNHARACVCHHRACAPPSLYDTKTMALR